LAHFVHRVLKASLASFLLDLVEIGRIVEPGDASFLRWDDDKVRVEELIAEG
jgi:hypothetical protein